MPTEADFLAAIREEPSDTTHSLVFADWLEDHDDPRAELVRGIAAHQMAQVPGLLTSGFRTCRLPVPERLALGGIAPLVAQGWLEVASTGLLEWSGNLLASQPLPGDPEAWRWVTHLRVGGAAPAIAGLLDQLPVRPVYLEWLLEPDQAADAELARSPLLGRVQSLHLRGADNGSNRNFARLLGSTLLTELQRLDVGSRELSSTELDALANNASLVGLRSLFLGYLPSDRGAFGRLLRASWWSQLRELRVLCRPNDGPALRLLAGSSNSSGLRVLEVDQPGEGTLDLEGLPGATFWPGLRAFSLNCPSLQTPTLTRMLGMLQRCELEALRLLQYPHSPDVLDAVAGCSYLSRTTHLTMTGKWPGPKPLQVIGRSKHLTSLRSLDLRANTVGDESLTHLSEWPKLERLRHLRLFKTSLTEAGARTLAREAGLRGLVSLDLAWANLGRDGIRTLSQSPHLRGLLVLILSGLSEEEKHRAGLRALFPHVWGMML